MATHPVAPVARVVAIRLAHVVVHHGVGNPSSLAGGRGEETEEEDDVEGERSVVGGAPWREEKRRRGARLVSERP